MKIKEVVDGIIDACGTPQLAQTCDRLMAGNWEAEASGIVTTFMATVEVIRQTIAMGANLIITHEPTYFTGRDTTEWLQGDEVFLLKKRLIDDHKINIWRFHDHMHMAKPDLIYAGLNKELGWESYRSSDGRHCYRIPAMTMGELSQLLKEKLHVNTVRTIGDREARIEHVGILVGGGSLGFGREEMPMEIMQEKNLDVLVCGEILEWTLPAYVRDASQLGLAKSLIILGHNRTEEVGMKHLPAWLSQLFPGMPVRFIESGEPFEYM